MRVFVHVPLDTISSSKIGKTESGQRERERASLSHGWPRSGMCYLYEGLIFSGETGSFKGLKGQGGESQLSGQVSGLYVSETHRTGLVLRPDMTWDLAKSRASK